MPHTEPRDFYVTMIRDKRTAFLVGPLPTHTLALATVSVARQEAYAVDPWSHFDKFGTSSLPRSNNNPVGKLNTRLGIVPRPPV